MTIGVSASHTFRNHVETSGSVSINVMPSTARASTSVRHAAFFVGQFAFFVFGRQLAAFEPLRVSPPERRSRAGEQRSDRSANREGPELALPRLESAPSRFSPVCRSTSSTSPERGSGGTTARRTEMLSATLRSSVARRTISLQPEDAPRTASLCDELMLTRGYPGV